MYQPYPSGGQLAEPPRPPAPAPVLAAVKFMYAGAAVSAVYLIIGLAFIIGDNKAGHATVNGHGLIAAQASHLLPLIITVALVSLLVPIALWLWMARANGQGRKWARILSTVLFGLATLELISVLPQLAGIQVAFGLTGLGLIFWVPTWLVGLAAVWLLWRPASSAFFNPQASRGPPPAHRCLRGWNRPGHDCRGLGDPVDLRARAGVARRAPGRLAGQGRAGTLLVRAITLNPL